MPVSSHSIAHDLSFDTVLLHGESEGCRGSIVQFHSSRGFISECISPSVWGDILQAEGGIIGAERVLTRSTQEEETNADHISDGKHVILNIIGCVSMMQNGAHNQDGNRLNMFRWRISFGVPSKLLTESKVDVSVAMHLDVWGSHPFVHVAHSL